MRFPYMLRSIVVILVTAQVSSIPFSSPLLSSSSTLLDKGTPTDLDPDIARLLNPSNLQSRQSPFSTLQIPSCALTCYINTLTTDGCSSETDFACHCSKGDILDKASDCLKKACDENDQKDARGKMGKACRAAVGGGDRPHGGGSGGGNGDGQDSMPTGKDMSRSAPSSSSGMTTTMSSSSGAGSALTTTPAPNTVPPNTDSPPSTSSTPTASSTSTSPDPTDIPLALLPTDRQLSPAAKAGISVSVSVFASAILLTIYLYIRRLKKDLALAKAAAGVPESVWRASIETAVIPTAAGRRRSWGGRGRSVSRRRSSGSGGGSWGGGSPVSPLSPRGGMEEGMTGVLKKKRGHVLSVVVEREEEESSSMHRIINEPVPGQREGLVDPLELDGEYTGLIELPTSVTPRARSMERTRERGMSAGEGSRPSTGGLEKIDERQGL